MEGKSRTDTKAQPKVKAMKMTTKQARGYREFLYIVPFLILVLIFSYYPLYGWIYAFFDYKPPNHVRLSDCEFVGLKYFISMVDTDVKRQTLFRVLRNTFAISGISLFFSWFPMIFAVFLNEIKCKPYRKFVQTVTTLPNFISWVLVFAIAYCIFNADGAINNVLVNNGIITDQQRILFLNDKSHLWFKMWLWLTWKNAGWAAIMYLAAISGIDEELIEAARVDGASRMKVIWHITIPSILPTYFVLVMLNLASFLSNGMEQFYVFRNSFNEDYIMVLDLYVYNLAMGKGANYPLSTAFSILKSLVSIGLLFAANGFSKKVRGEGII